jgi:hypothetical protein
MEAAAIQALRLNRKVDTVHRNLNGCRNAVACYLSCIVFSGQDNLHEHLAASRADHDQIVVGSQPLPFKAPADHLDRRQLHPILAAAIQPTQSNIFELLLLSCLEVWPLYPQVNPVGAG